MRCFVSAGLMKFQRGELAHLSGNFSRHLSGEAASSGSSASGWHLQNMNEDILYLQNRTLISLNLFDFLLRNNFLILVKLSND